MGQGGPGRAGDPTHDRYLDQAEIHLDWVGDDPLDYGIIMFGKSKLAIVTQGGWRTLPREFFESFTRMLIYTMPKCRETTLELFYVSEVCVDVGRNRAVKRALDWHADFLMLLDLDQAVLPDTLERFAKVMTERPDLDIVSPLIAMRNWPYNPCAYNVIDAKHKYIPAIKGRHGVIEVDIVGAGCLMIRRRVFEISQPPWFAFVQAKDGTSTEVSEDFYFCFKVNAAGLKIGLDLDHEIGHLNMAYITVGRNWNGKDSADKEFPVMDIPKQPSRFDWQRHVKDFERGECHLKDEE
jgi:hypothetical protein